MDNTIYFEENVTTYYFYTKILRRFYDIYKADKKKPPVLNFCATKYITPEAMPLILSFGDYLRRLYKQRIMILCEKSSEVQNFFICSKFFYLSKMLDIFEWEDFIIDWEYKPLREQHKIEATKIHYTDANRIEDPMQRRNYIYDCLLEKNYVVYSQILRDTDRLPDNVIAATVKAIAEIQTNAIMYSGTYSFTLLASDRYGTKISISDSGMGFEQSFEKENRTLKMREQFESVPRKFRNYLTIMSALDYSYVKHIHESREDLWTLRTTVVKNNGVFKVQYNNTQVIFSSGRCGKCTRNEGKEDISACVECLLKEYSPSTYSPIKIFNVGFQGVRIEMVINREG